MSSPIYGSIDSDPRPAAAGGPTPDHADESLLLEVPVPFRRIDGRPWVEKQALNGLRCWSDNFARLTVCAPELPAGHPDEASTEWADPAPLLASRDVTLDPLPWGYRRFDGILLAGGVRERLGRLIDSHRYLCFGNVGGFGAWGNLAVAEARARGRAYSLWFDNVAHEMPRDPARSVLGALKTEADRQYGKFQTLRAIRHAGLGLFHGKTVFDAYQALCPRPALVHDIHLQAADALSDDALAAKLASQLADRPLRIGYAGRAHPIKGPFDWIASLVELAARVGGDRFEATWIGAGPALDEARDRVRQAGLADSVRFVGHVSDRAALLAALRDFDVFLFCHLTPESPRCLIEALVSGTPLVGYDSAYARDLVGERGGACFTALGDTGALAGHLARLVEGREERRAFIAQAATARALYNDAAVFKHRSDLIKTTLR